MDDIKVEKETAEVELIQNAEQPEEKKEELPEEKTEDKKIQDSKKADEKSNKKNNKKNNRTFEKKNGILWRLLFFTFCFVYLELEFHMIIYKSFSKDIIYPFMFGVAIGSIVSVLTIIFKKIGNAIIGYFFVSIACIYNCVQLIYYKIFGVFLSLVSVGGAENAMDFKTIMFQRIRENIGFMLLLLLPIVALIFLNKFIVSFKRPKAANNIIGVAVMLVLCVGSIFSLNIGGRGMYSPYKLFHGKFILELSMDKLGLFVTTGKDAVSMLSKKEETAEFELNEDTIIVVEKPDIATATDANPEDATPTDVEGSGEIKEVVYYPQIADNVNLSAKYYETEDQNLKNLTAYFSNKTPTYENDYTGIYEGYNVVFVTAESLSKYGISDTCTPTLYKIMNEGYVFNNFYNPLWYHSTIDGEYINCLGQYPSSYEWSFYKSADTYQPYALGNALGQEGYAAYAYHDYNFYYYDRAKTHANMGYDFKAIDYGLEIPYNEIYSDLDTMEAVYTDFINEDKFVMYFMSFSGHLPYYYYCQSMSAKNREEAEKLTEGMNLPEEAVAYIAAQMELDKALEFLMEKLEKAGKLDNTIFIVTPDHYPYGLSDGMYNVLAGQDIEGDKFELHRACLGIWNSQMEEPVVVDKLCASVDVLPTILNMMGVDYDSRLLAGHDIMAESEELVIFSDHSFITDLIKYNTKTGRIEYLTDVTELEEGYLDEKIQEVENILQMSDKMITYDYFRFFYGVE